MKLGIYLNAQHPRGDDPARRFAETLEQARVIRALGFDSIWGGEHHATPGFHYFPLMPMLQRLAAEAEGLAFGTNLVLLPLHNPVEIAEIAAFLDIATGGRFTLGIGLGYRSEEFAIFGVRMAERVSRLTEGVELIGRLWTEDAVTHHGRHWTLDKVTIRPRPLQTPRPLILVGSQVPAGIERAARIADGWLVVPVPTIEEFASQVRIFTAARTAAGPPRPRSAGSSRCPARPTRTRRSGGRRLIWWRSTRRISRGASLASRSIPPQPPRSSCAGSRGTGSRWAHLRRSPRRSSHKPRPEPPTPPCA